MKKTALVLLVVALACGKKDEDGPAGAKPTDTKPTDTKPKAAATDAPDLAVWDIEGKKKAWQGSWLVKENGTLQAWSVAGDKVTVWDGKEEKTYTLKADLPCNAEFADEKGYMYPRPFTVTDGKLRFRVEGAGYRKGNEAIFCDMSGEVWTLSADGKCAVWKDKFGKWEKSDGECGIKKNDQGQEVFFHKGSNEGEFAIEGDAILSKTSQETESFADLAAAKAARDAKAAQ